MADAPASPRWIAGLGNPGEEYRATRHNAGVWYVERLAKERGVALRSERRLSSVAARCSVGGGQLHLHLLVPTTFMNHSGRALRAYADYYKLEPASLLVAHDELDLPPGHMKLKRGGGHGGHNGLRDIIAQLGTGDFWRLRIGIGHPGHKSAVTGYVLRRAPAAEQDLLDEAIALAAGETDALVDGEFARVQQQLHSHRPEN